MELLLEAIIEFVGNTPPDRSDQLARLIGKLASAKKADVLGAWATNPTSKTRLNKLIAAWQSTDVPPVEVAGMLMGASAAYHHVRAEQEIELVWTGPSSKLIATRKTEQALLQVIDASSLRLFITSFVAYNVTSIMKALERAVERGTKSQCCWRPVKRTAAVFRSTQSER